MYVCVGGGGGGCDAYTRLIWGLDDENSKNENENDRGRCFKSFIFTTPTTLLE